MGLLEELMRCNSFELIEVKASRTVVMDSDTA